MNKIRRFAVAGSIAALVAACAPPTAADVCLMADAPHIENTLTISQNSIVETHSGVLVLDGYDGPTELRFHAELRNVLPDDETGRAFSNWRLDFTMVAGQAPSPGAVLHLGRDFEIDTAEANIGWSGYPNSLSVEHPSGDMTLTVGTDGSWILNGRACAAPDANNPFPAFVQADHYRVQ